MTVDRTFLYCCSDQEVGSLVIISMCTSLQAIGDSGMAYQCFKLAVTINNDHAEAYNNIGVLEWKRDKGEQVCTWGREGGVEEGVEGKVDGWRERWRMK